MTRPVGVTREHGRWGRIDSPLASVRISRLCLVSIRALLLAHRVRHADSWDRTCCDGQSQTADDCDVYAASSACLCSSSATVLPATESSDAAALQPRACRALLPSLRSRELARVSILPQVRQAPACRVAKTVAGSSRAGLQSGRKDTLSTALHEELNRHLGARAEVQ